MITTVSRLHVRVLRLGFAVACLWLAASATGDGQSAGAPPRAPRTAERLGPLPVSKLDDGAGGGEVSVGATGSPAQLPPLVPPQTPPQPPLEPLPISRLDERQQITELDRGQPFTLTFSEPVSIRELLLMLVNQTDLGVVMEPEVKGEFVGELKNVTLRQALDLILHPLGFDYTLEDGILRIFRRRTETRIFNIDYVLTRRSGTRSISASSSAGGGGTTFGLGGVAATGVAGGVGAGATGIGGGGGGGGGGAGGSSATVSGTDTGDVFDELSEGLRGMLSTSGRFTLNRKAALLQVTDFAEHLDRVALYLDSYMARVHRQVQIQAKVIEVELRDESQAGINWTAVFRKAGHTATVTQNLAPSTSGAFTLGVDIRNFTGLLSAFATQGKVNVLSSPQVIAMNNEPAIMRVGTQDVFFVTSTQIDPTSGRLLQTTVSPQAITEGVVLSVTPQISADGIISMSISPSVTERTGQATSRLGDTVPIISVRETDTLVRVRQGETILIAGLMQDRLSTNTSKVPVLGDVPLVGGLFRRQEKTKRKTDLIILLTPTVLTPGGIATTAAEAQERLFEAQRKPPNRP